MKEDLKTVTKQTDMMSTVVRITALGTDLKKTEKTVDDTLKMMQSLAALFNIYNPNSEISRINKDASEKPVIVSTEMQKILQAAGHAHEETAGYFDVTVGPLVTLWKEAKKTGVIPSEGLINKTKKKTDFQDIVVEKNTVYFKKKGMSIDLGGIAKGYILSRSVAYMKEQGISSGLVDIGGDLYAWGRKADGTKWRVGIRHPRKEGAFLKIVNISEKAVLSSGDYERYFIKDGRRYSHIINPFTGYPDSDIISVTVMGPHIMDIDGYSAGLLAMGSVKAIDKCKRLKKENKINDFIIAWQDEKGEMHIWKTIR